jgi:protein-disulfide isomerase
MVIDVGTLLCAGILLYRPEPVCSPRTTSLTLLAIPFAVVLPVGWQFPTTEEIVTEEEIASSLLPPLAVEQRAGFVTVVEFLDPSCDECQHEDEALRLLSSRYNDKVRIVRKIIAKEERERASAKAICCAEQLGFGNQMAAAAFSFASPSPEDLENIAARLNIDSVSYRECIESPWSTEQLNKTNEDSKVLQVETLPTIWIQAEKLEGHQSAEELQRCIERAFEAL